MTPRLTEAVCACGAAFTKREFPLGELWVGSALCPECDKRHDDEIRAEKDRQMQSFRLSKWKALEMPFQDGPTATVREELPAANVGAVLRWRYQSKGLVITGDTGLGKTRTLVELLKDTFIIHGHEPAFIRFTEWKIRLDRAHRYGGEGVEKFVRPFMRVPVLAVDDLGHGSFKENTLACFFELVDARTSKGLPTHFTTQHSKQSLKAAFDAANPKTSEALIRRMEEFCRLVAFVPKDNQAEILA